MGLSGLDSALSGLRIAQQQLDNIANNVSNVSTPGYSRKILPQVTVAPEGITAGVRGMPVIRNVDMNLSRDLWTQVSATEFYNVQATYLDRIQQFHGDPAAEINVAAQLAELRDAFSALADSPEETSLQRAVVDQAQTVAQKINNFADLISEMRNDAQSEIAVAVQKVNDLLGTIAETNKQIKFNKAVNKTTAQLEDTRDTAVQELTKLMNISFFIRGDGVLVVQTDEGVQLADERAEEVYFDNAVLGPTSYYPASGGGIYVGGNPADNNNAIEITTRGIGSKIGALVELRDTILPQQQAQLDEMAHKLSLRFEAQGLRLFTDANGQIPADTAPVPNPPGPLTPVTYVGYSSVIQVNEAIIGDNRLIQQGTEATDMPVLNGSNEVIRRVLQFTFGDYEYQQAVGNVDLRSNGTGGVSMQDWLGIYSQNTVTGEDDLRTYTDLNALMTAGGLEFQPPPPAAPLNAQFAIVFEEARLGLGPVTVNIDLAAAQVNFPIAGPIANGADQLVAEINAQITAAALPAGLTGTASINQYGQLVIQSNGNITVDNDFIGGMSDIGLGLLGLTDATYTTVDPYLDIQVGNNNPVRITIEPGDTEVELMDKLEFNGVANPGIPDLYADMDALTGFLTLRPGGDDSNGGPEFGGDIKIIGGPFTATGAGANGTAAGTSLVQALFGNAAPVVNVNHPPFRSSQLGQGVDISTGIINSTSLIDFTQKMVNRQTEQYNLAAARQGDAQTFRDLLQERLSDQSSVNIEEELANMIVMQTAFSAAARVITAIDEQFQELLRSV
jgi:flagellar hook-associated protein 1 FlgK